MIEALIKLGRAILKKESGGLKDFKEDIIHSEEFPESLAPYLYLLGEQTYDFEAIQQSEEPNYPYITKIIFNISTNPPKFVKVEAYRQMGMNDNNAVVFRGAVGGLYSTPTIKGFINSKAIKVKIEKESKNCFQNFIKTLNRYDEGSILRKIANLILADKDAETQIQAELEKVGVLALTDKHKVNFIITLGVEFNGETKIYSEDKQVRMEVLKMVLKSLKFDKLRNKEIHCSCCGKKTRVLTISGKPWAFFSLDKPSYRNNSGFRKATQFPICQRCAVLLEIGRCYIENNLAFRMAAVDFYLIPRLMFENSTLTASVLSIKGDYLASVKSLTSFTDQEDALFRALARRDNGITYDLLFYEIQQSKFLVRMHIRDVAPSQISRVYKSMIKIRKMNKLRFDFWSIRKNYIQRGEPNETEMTTFLEMLDKIFTGFKISRREIQKVYLRNHKTKIFANKGNEKQSTLHFFYTTTMRDFMEFLVDLDQLGK